MIVNEGLANVVASRRKSLLTVTTTTMDGMQLLNPSSPAHTTSILTSISGGDLQSLSPSAIHLKPAKQSKINEYLEQRRPRRVSVAVNKGRTSLSPSTASLNLSQNVSPNNLSQSISSPIKITDSNISFRRDEIDQMYENPLCLRKVREAFLYNGSDAFQNFCSIVTRGKESASPSRRRRREAYMEIFAALAGLSASKIYAENIDIESVTASFDDIAIGLKSLSDRWLTYSSDELYSLAFLMDINEKGSVSWTDFFEFMLGIHEALAEDYRQNPAKVFESLYDDLKEISYQASLGIPPSSQNRVSVIPNTPQDDSLFVRLQCLATYARNVLGVQPLTTLLQAAGPIGSDMYAGDLLHLLNSLGAQIDDAEFNSPNNGDKAVGKEIPVSPIPKVANDQYKTKHSIHAGVSSRDENHTVDNTEDTVQSFHHSIQDLRVTAKKISEKIAEQDGNMEETMGIWSAIHSIEKNFNRLVTLSPTNEKPTDATSPHDELKSPNKSSNKTIFKLFTEQSSENNDDSNIDINTNVPFSPVTQEKSNKVGAGLARASVTINTSMNSNYEYKVKSPTGTVATRRRSLESTPKELRRSSVAASTMHSNASPSGSSSVASSKHIAHFRNSIKPVNLSIFRSPGGRIVHPNRNSYDNSTYSWKPTVITGKYNDRFQTTHDLMEAKKMNSILYNHQ